MSAPTMVREYVTHKVQARDDHPSGDGQVRWYASFNGGESYLGVKEEPEDGAYMERKSNTIPISLAYPRGFRLCGLTLIGKPVALTCPEGPEAA